MTPTYILGCDETPERKAASLAHFHARGVDPVWWRGFHGKTWGLDTTREYEPGRRISPGHVGLDLGVWALWQHLLLSHGNHPDHRFLVFEDDAVLPDNWDAHLAGVERDLDRSFPQWELVFLGLAETEPHVWNKVTERVGGPDSRLCRLTDPFGTHAIMLRRSALLVLLDNMRHAERNLDQQLWKYVLRPGLVHWCAVLPSLVEQRTFDHRLRGKPEWGPSTIDPENVPAPAASRPNEAPDEWGDLPGKPSAERLRLTIPYVDPFPCIYRGEYLDDAGETRSGKSVVLSDCMYFNQACHSQPVKKVGVVHTTGPGPTYQALECEGCEKRLGMAAPAARARLPLQDHFNPGMAVTIDGRVILATRDSWGHSRIGLWHLTNPEPDWSGEWVVEPIGSFASNHPEAPRLEDPRLFWHLGPGGNVQLHAMLNLPDAYPPKVVRVGYVRFDLGLKRIEHTEIFTSPEGNRYEKNWMPLSVAGDLWWVYQTKPEHVVMSGDRVWRTPNPLVWKGGVIRGGAPPVRMGNVFYHFFHGCMKRTQGSVYTVGCCVFEGRPPFRVLRQTPVPLIYPDLPAPGEDVVKRYVVWPGGAVPHAGHWHLALGIDDTFCRVVRIPFGAVEDALSDIPETAPGPSIRGTPLARGVSGP